MNDNLQAALLQIINNTTKAVDKGIDFLSEQIPDVLHQLLMWKMYQSLIVCAIFFILAIVAFVMSYKLFKSEHWQYELGPMLLLPFGISFGLGAAAISNYEWLQILIAPKIYLLEYAAHLVKGN